MNYYKKDNDYTVIVKGLNLDGSEYFYTCKYVHDVNKFVQWLNRSRFANTWVYGNVYVRRAYKEGHKLQVDSFTKYVPLNNIKAFPRHE